MLVLIALLRNLSLCDAGIKEEEVRQQKFSPEIFIFYILPYYVTSPHLITNF